MKNELSSLIIQQIQSAVTGVKEIITSKQDLNIEKESILMMLEQVDYFVGKHDEYCEQINEVFGGMVDFDFSKRLSSCEENDNNLINVISQGLNMVNEELGEKAIHKNIFRTLLETLSLNKIVVITDSRNNIIFANTNLLPDFKEENFIGKPIGLLFDQYELILHLMKADSLIKGISIDMNWNGSLIPTIVKIGLSMNHTKLDGIVYLIDLNEDKK